MYSRATPFEKSDRIIGTHQKIDRAARLVLKKIKTKAFPERAIHFPSIDEILRFEGMGGPDGIKAKSPGKDEPWHFVDPYGDKSRMFNYIENHLVNLSQALKDNNYVRASFEAGWMAHAITDALTPAHQFPLDDKILEITGKSQEARDTRMKKMFLPGNTWREKFSHNWEYLGPKGVMSSHMLYEMGVAILVSSLAAKKISQIPSDVTIGRLMNGEFFDIFNENIKKVADKHYYQRYIKKGWTSRLARETKFDLLPLICETVALAWLEGVRRSQMEDL